MVTGLILSPPKKSCILISLVLLLFLCSCEEPYNKSNEWLCETPYFSLLYTRDSQGILVQTEALVLDGELIAVDLLFGRGIYCVYPEGSNHYEDRLFSGSWEYRAGNLVLTIEEDFAFDGEYDRIVLSPVKSD